MQHDTFTEKISQWLDHELNADEVTELQQHLSQCQACRHAYRAMQDIDQLFHHASTSIVEPEPGFTSRFEARLAHHTAVKRWHMWAGMGVLLVSTLLFVTIGVVMTGAALLSTGMALFSTSSLYYGLGLIGEIVNETRVFVNLAGLGLEIALLVMSQPLFWGLVIVALGLAGLWVRLVQSVYRREIATVQLFV